MRLSLGVQTLYEVTVPEQKRFVNDGDAWHFSARTRDIGRRHLSPVSMDLKICAS